MSFIAAAAIAAGSALVGGYMQSDAIGDAADQSAAGEAARQAEARRQFDLQRSDFAPYRDAGVNALRQYAGEIGSQPTAAEVMGQPGYQFGLDEGMRSLQRQQAAAGGRISGAAMRRGTRYATDYATSGYGAAYQRSQDRLNRLASLAQLGQTSTGASAAAGAAQSQIIGQGYANTGETRGAAGLARANTWADTGNQLAALYSRSQQPVGGQAWGAPSYGAGNWSPGAGDGFETNPMGGY